MKRFKYLLICLTFVCISCTNNDIEEDINTPTFKVLCTEKHYVDDIFHCMTILDIKGLTDKYSIDGILYANDIQGINFTLPSDETYKYETRYLGDGKYYFNISGRHHGNVQLKIVWTSKDNRENYLVGWHLTYGFGPDCEVLIINLNN